MTPQSVAFMEMAQWKSSPVSLCPLPGSCMEQSWISWKRSLCPSPAKHPCTPWVRAVLEIPAPGCPYFAMQYKYPATTEIVAFFELWPFRTKVGNRKGNNVSDEMLVWKPGKAEVSTCSDIGQGLQRPIILNIAILNFVKNAKSL